MEPTTYEIRSVAENVWAIKDSGFVTSFLIVGEKEALLVDAGGALTDIRGEIEKITDKPLTLVLTHSHGDHVVCIDQFDEAYAGKEDISAIIKNKNPQHCKLIPLEEGQLFDLGGRTIKAMSLRGHSPGGFAYLDVENKLLFSGDTINLGPIYLFGDGTDLDTLISELERYKKMDCFELIFPAHNVNPIGRDRINDILDCCYSCKNGSIEGKEMPEDSPLHGVCRLFSKNGCGLYLK